MRTKTIAAFLEKLDPVRGFAPQRELRPPAAGGTQPRPAK